MIGSREGRGGAERVEKAQSANQAASQSDLASNVIRRIAFQHAGAERVEKAGVERVEIVQMEEFFPFIAICFLNGGNAP